MVFMEAMSAGLPVVTTDLGSAREMFDESCGILTPADDVAEFSSALRFLVSNSDKRRKMGDAAVLRINSLSNPATQLTRYLALLSEANVGGRAAVNIPSQTAS